MDKLREKIAEYLYDCDNGIFPNRTVIIEWRLASEGDKAEYYRRADQILGFIKDAHADQAYQCQFCGYFGRGWKGGGYICPKCGKHYDWITAQDSEG